MSLGDNPASTEALLREIEAEARRGEFPIDREPYQKCGRDPLVPIPWGGNLDARICSFGRDLGRDEVRDACPQIGPAGRLVRQGLLAAAAVTPPPEDRLLECALPHVLLANTVPYKPPGNKAYAPEVKRRFRPFVERLLVHHWRGDVVLTLGTEAFAWFSPYCDRAAASEFWNREDRYEAEFRCTMRAQWNGRSVEKPLILCPLPHPSPLNRKWLGLFPELLQRRLQKWLK